MAKDQRCGGKREIKDELKAPAVQWEVKRPRYLPGASVRMLEMFLQRHCPARPPVEKQGRGPQH